MKHGSLFSGIGGFDLAAQWMGWDNVFHCEWNEFGQRVLHHYWPQAIQYNDITKTDFTIHRGAIDILTGGFPCQPYSAAGKRLGKEDERHLWPEMLRAIREIQPRWVVGENVRGLTNWNGGLVFDEVQSDLEAIGYEVLPFLLPACAKDAPHRRDRIWFVAYRNDQKCNGGSCSSERERQASKQGRNGVLGSTSRPCQKRPTPNANNGGRPQHAISAGREELEKLHGASRDVADASNEGLQRCKINGSVRKSEKESNQFFTGCLPSTWQNFPTQPPICSGDDGLPTELDGITFPKWRNESIKAYGNAVVPQVVHEIFKAINQYHTQ